MRRTVETLLLVIAMVSPLAAQSAALQFIDTGFENASPLWYDVEGEVIRSVNSN